MGIQPERSHHEQGPGQNEIDFRCASPLHAADDLMTMRAAVKAIAAQNGLFASFLPKPLQDESGSGLHINLSIFQNGVNLFENFRTDPHPTAAAFLAGILRRIPEITVFADPLPGSCMNDWAAAKPRVWQAGPARTVLLWCGCLLPAGPIAAWSCAARTPPAIPIM